MSSSIRIQLCLLLATVSCFALPPGDKANGITSSCRFGQYDLCPLFQRPRVMIIDSPQRSYRAQRRYRLDFWATDDHSQCPKGTWLCITETNRARTKAIAVPRFFLADDGAIHLQSPSVSAFDVDIRLVCDPDGLSMIPRFTSESSGTHIFTWASRHA
ncbi:hypothetical protein C8J56DRAFT_360172 [Mycena floridula]|nr:hypothetical protein C8J56DRAFT_360172 [Mycena floridula]